MGISSIFIDTGQNYLVPPESELGPVYANQELRPLTCLCNTINSGDAGEDGTTRCTLVLPKPGREKMEG